ncbi:hypothetical protein ACROSR_14920 [Roseovarius tibetensis]|uniref:hypothetical protein n=1 Tax=Roseovarius tibetensis TaxID=2685897 RepID=UPI003D7F6EB8
MIIIIGAVLGGIVGAVIARRRKGELADVLQYAFVYALLFGIAGLFATLIIHRSMI